MMHKQYFVFPIILTLCLLTVTWVAVNFGSAQTGTNVNGIINSDTVWSASGSPYTLTGPVGVIPGVRLTIQPGVIVEFGTYYLQVNGTLNAVGSASNPIIFNGNPNEFSGSGFDVLSGNSRYQILFYYPSTTDCIIQNAVLNYVPIQIYNASPKITCNLIWFNQSVNNYQDAIGIIDGSPIISNNSINIINKNFMSGVSVKTQSTNWVKPVISNNSIVGTNCTNGKGVDSNGNATISYNLISGLGYGVYSDNRDRVIINNTIIGNLICNNKGDYMCGIYFTSTFSPGVYSDWSTVENNTIINNTNGIGIIDSTAKPSIRYNNIYDNQYNIYLYDFASANITAINNWWGTTDSSAINQKLYDWADNFNLGNVTFAPFLTSSSSSAPLTSFDPSPNQKPTPTPTPTATPSSTPATTPNPTTSPTATTSQPSVIPEFSPTILLPLIIVALASMAIIGIKRQTKTRQQ
jgi:hypothetical protein